MDEPIVACTNIRLPFAISRGFHLSLDTLSFKKSLWLPLIRIEWPCKGVGTPKDTVPKHSAVVSCTVVVERRRFFPFRISHLRFHYQLAHHVGSVLGATYLIYVILYSLYPAVFPFCFFS